jgi:sugar/nucleoside kinase (ribokinase family)
VTRPIVAGLGRIGVSVTALAHRVPEAGSGDAGELAAVSLSPGAGVAVAARAAQALGCRGRLGGWVGSDSMGAFARAALTRAGVDVELVRAAPGGSRCEIVTVDIDGRRLVQVGGDEDIDEDALPVDLDALLAGTKALLLDDSCPRAQARAAARARERGIPVIVDLTAPSEGAAELVAFADVLISSERMASELAPRRDLITALGDLISLGPRAVVVTLGAAGAVGRHGGDVIEVAGYPVETLDSCGAGSVFHGAFVAGLLGELPFARCVELASAAAALSCQTLGPWDGIPEREETVEFITSRR